MKGVPSVRSWARGGVTRLVRSALELGPDPRILLPHVDISPTSILRMGEGSQIAAGIGCHIGAFCVLDLSADPQNPQGNCSELVLGDNVYINELNNIRCAGSKVEIGDDCLISQFVSIIGANHGIRRSSTTRSQPWSTGGVRIGSDVWIGAGAVILPRSQVEDGAVIGAGAVVTGVVPAYAIAVGNPVRLVGKRGV